MAHDHQAFDPTELDALFERVLAGEATPAERDRLDAALAQEGVPAEWRVAVGRAVRATVPRLDYDADAFSASVQSRITTSVGTRHATRSVLTWSRPGLLAGLGAAAAVVCGVAISRVAPSYFSRTHIAVERTYATARAQRAAVTLPGGTSVVLAPETQLRYTRTDRGGEAVDVQGEAFFTVAHRADRPFLVHAGGVTTRVLGTSFDVRRYATDRDAQVLVVTGRVAVSGRGTPVILTAGTVGRVTDSSVATVSSVSDLANASAWTEGRLVFQDTPVPAMLETVGRWYGYQFHLADTALATQHVTVTFHADRVAEALNKLKAVLSVTMTFDGDVITLHAERAADRGHGPIRRGSRDSSGHLETEVGK